MKIGLNTVLESFVESDLALVPLKHKDTPKKLKFQRKYFMSKLRLKMKKDSNFNRSVREICKFGWDEAFRKQILRRNLSSMFQQEYITRRRMN